MIKFEGRINTGVLREKPYTVYPVRWDTYFLVNRVENQKLNQTTAELPFG